MLEVEMCSDSVSYLWSTGDTTLNINNFVDADYTLTVSNGMGCMDTLEFNVPFVDTTAFFINIEDRNNEAFDVDSIRVMRSNGTLVRTEIERLSRGSYSFTSPQTIIRGDLICLEVDDTPAQDLSVLDIIKAQRHVLGLQVACEDDQLAGDVNFSGMVSGADIAAMQRIILAFDTVYNANRTRIFKADETPNVNLRRLGCVEIEAANLNNRSIDIKAIKLGNYTCED